MRVNGQWLFVDPRSWNLDWDVTVNVGIGSGSTERKLATLGAIAEQQKELIANMGPDNPMTDVSRYRNTLERLSTLAGYPDGAQFWKTPQESQQVIEAMQQQPPQPSPEMILAQNEVQKAEAQAQAKQVELQMKAAESQQNVQIEQMKMETSLQVEREKLAADIMMQREKLAAETQLAEQELALKYAAEDAKAERDTNATATQQSQASQPGIHLMLPDSIGGAVGTPMQMMAEHQTMMGEQQMQAMAEIVAGMQQTVAQLAQVAQSIAAVASTLSQPQVLVQQPEKANPVNLRIERDADGKMSGVRGVA